MRLHRKKRLKLKNQMQKKVGFEFRESAFLYRFSGKIALIRPKWLECTKLRQFPE